MRPEALQEAVVGLVIFAAAVKVQAHLIQRIRADGGQVCTDEFRMPDALVASVLAAFFCAAILGALLRSGPAPALQASHIIPGAIVLPIVAIGVCGFLKYRGLRLIPLFGLDRLAPWRAAGWALGLVILAFVFAGTANWLTTIALRGQAEQQQLVRLFGDVVRQKNHLALAQIFFAAVVFAPLSEEVLFRGFFYPLGKRYLGPLASGFVTALLFAAVHSSLTALAGLFVLALCLTLAYERTGSLLVPIGMHALFNFTSLVFVYGQARGFLPAS
ncbi:MAG: CPBP family intramembrane metalloprotease [Chthoniobacter sp.]|nr:CPBP family intramembrane metalloprotease [Chthoniobacter sp.]